MHPDGKMDQGLIVDDSSYEHFTPGQETRMYQMWDTFRAGK